jgi:formylglycine-generating enzyme required for sulfatase activity
MDGYRSFGYLSLLNEYNIELVDLAQEDWVDAVICDHRLQPMPARVARRVVESDYRISVAPIKTHNTIITTLSLKNMALGALRDRWLYHLGWPAAHLTLYALAPLVAPHLSILDGFQGMEGDGPIDGEAVDLRVAIASSDFVAADTIGSLVMDQDPRQVGYLVYSHRGGLGQGDADKIELRGNTSLQAAKRSFQKSPTHNDQLGWRTPAAARMVLPGSAGTVEWQDVGKLAVRAAATYSRDGSLAKPDVLPSWETVGQALLPPMVTIPSNTSIMGEVVSESEQYDHRRHEIDLPLFRIGLYPVTNEEYAQFVNDGGYTEKWKTCWTDAGWRYVQDYSLCGPRGWDAVPDERNHHPVVGVSLYEAWAYCTWLRAMTGQRFVLPSEAQWEKAARGKDGRRYPWGNEWASERCNSAEAGIGHTTPVTQYPDGRSPYGLYDMAGNVWEWCNSTSDSYPYCSEDGREDPCRCTVRIVRGGSWFELHSFLRCAFRNHFTESFRGDHLGFRVAELPA